MRLRILVTESGTGWLRASRKRASGGATPCSVPSVTPLLELRPGQGGTVTVTVTVTVRVRVTVTVRRHRAPKCCCCTLQEMSPDSGRSRRSLVPAGPGCLCPVSSVLCQHVRDIECTSCLVPPLPCYDHPGHLGLHTDSACRPLRAPSAGRAGFPEVVGPVVSSHPHQA